MPDPISVTAGGVRWQIPPRWRDCLLGPDGLRLPEWLAAGQARLVKQGPHRTVYHVTLPELDFHLKHYPLADGRAWLRGLVRPSKARTEYEQALAVAARGVPTFEPLALGETCGLGPCSSYLLTLTLPGAMPLSSFVEMVLSTCDPLRQARLRQRLAVALGRFLAHMHQVGVLHHDLHPGNILLRLDAHDGALDLPTLYLIDLHDVHLDGRLSWGASRANLVVLNRWFMLRSNRTDRLRFWHAYEEARRQAGGDVPGVHASANGKGTGDANHGTTRKTIRDLERRSLASNVQFWRRLDRRSRSKSRHFRRLSTPEVSGHAVADLPAEALAPLLANPDAPFESPGAVVLKRSPSSAVVELDLPTADGVRRVIYKRFAVTRWTDPWTALVRPTPALRSYVLGHSLLLRHVPTPRPLAVWHRRRLGLLHEGYLITEKVPDAVDLRGCLALLDSRPEAERRAGLRLLVERVAQLVSTLHQRQLSQRDLKASNVLVAGAGRLAWQDCAVWLIDLVGVRRHRKLSHQRRIQNLARLHASFQAAPGLTRTDKLRFLSVYLRWGLRGRLGWKTWWREVESATHAKVRRNQRLGRPLT
jgi:tRNA A-37 threonylcarbamoyl transferase component Bud32